MTPAVSPSRAYFPDMDGRCVVVTGGASGIGRAACLAFAEAGARVVVGDVDERGGQETVRLIGAGQALFVPCDVSKAADAAGLMRAAQERFGRLDVLYNNAAAVTLCNDHDRPVHELDETVWDRMLDISLKGVFMCSKYALPQMMAQKGGVIINTTSVTGLIAEYGCDSYTAAKSAIVGLTRSMATEYAPYSIRVVAIAPGYVITPNQHWYHNDAKARALADAWHLTRIGRAEDIADLALFLASDRAAFITGTTIVADGGFTAFKNRVPITRMDGAVPGG